MTHISTNDLWTRGGIDYRVAIAAGQFPGWSFIHKFGSNPNLGTVIEDVWTVGGIFTPEVTGTLMDVVSNNAEDINLTGDGAWTVKLEGLNDNFEAATEIVELNGTDIVTTTTEFTRVYRFYVLDSGVRRAGASGDIIIRVTGGGNIQGQILHEDTQEADWHFGQTQLGRYTVPRGKTAFLTRITVHNERSKSADFVIFRSHEIDRTSAPFLAPRIFVSFSGVEGHEEIVYRVPHKFDELTDIFTRARMTVGSSGKVSVDMEFLVFDGVIT